MPDIVQDTEAGLNRHQTVVGGDDDDEGLYLVSSSTGRVVSLKDGQPAKGKVSIQQQQLTQAELERLGRMRPEMFTSAWQEYLFVLSICLSQVISEYFVSGFNVLLPSVTEALNIPQAASTWPANAFSLVLACFLLVFGRFADMYGGKIIYIFGLGWMVVWALIGGFSQNELMMDFSRAIAGFGPAAFLPAGVMLMGNTYRPGPRKNLVFSIYGAAAPFGFFIGILFAGVSAQYLNWRYYFYFGAILTFISFILAIFIIPSDAADRKVLNIEMDWAGSSLIVSGLILLVFAITQSSSAPDGWKSAQILAPFFVSIALLCGAWYVEGYWAEMPLLPFDIFTGQRMFCTVIVVMFLSFGGLGMFLLYATFYMENILMVSPIHVVLYFVPMAFGGLVISIVGGTIFHRLSGTVLMLISSTAWVISPLLFAVMTPHPVYWAFIFPSMICATTGIDISFNIANIYITSALPSRQQGLAGALVNSLLQLSIALFLGLADVINNAIVQNHTQRYAYKAVFWFAAATAALALSVTILFVRLDPAKSDKTADEKELDKQNLEKERLATKL